MYPLMKAEGEGKGGLKKSLLQYDDQIWLINGKIPNPLPDHA